MTRFACPACDRPLYNRRRTNCEFCGATVPASLLMSQTQQARVDDICRGDRRRHGAGGRGSGSSSGDSSSDIGFFDSGSSGDCGCDGGGVGGCD